MANRLRMIYLHIGIVWHKGNQSVSVFDADMLNDVAKYQCRRRTRRARAPYNWWYMMNHDPFNPNTKLVITQDGRRVRAEWVALRNIYENEEITWSYDTDTERALKMFGPEEV